MAYQALYRTWRPSHFGEVVGQDHITKVLYGQIALEKISHAYLFAGPRGTGKTSLAKIFASAVNCTDRQQSEPCGQCEACKNGTVDTIEIDAASNNGVDSVREIRDRVSLLPALCTYKVYIIDEAHMLTKGAFNALLKTLEEPPPHVIFILATTEPHKLPQTIRSRCQRYDFRRIPTDVIVSLLQKVADAEKFEYDKNALVMIARAAEGGMRDALSILDQCIAFGKIDTQAVSSVLGGTDISKVNELAGFISKYDEKSALEMLRSIIDSGADTRALIKDLSDVFRRMMWISCGADIEGYDELKPMAKAFGKNASIRALDILIAKEYEMRQNLRADIVLETAVMALMAPEDDASSGLSERIEKLESKLTTLQKQGIKIAADPAAQSMQPEPQKQTEPKKSAPKPASSAKPKQKSEGKQEAYWQNMLSSLMKEEYFVFAHAKLALKTDIKGSKLEITFDIEDEISAEFMKGESAKKAVLDRIVKDAPEVKQISIMIQSSKEETSADLNILEMFGTDIEEI